MRLRACALEEGKTAALLAIFVRVAGLIRERVHVPTNLLNSSTGLGIFEQFDETSFERRLDIRLVTLGCLLSLFLVAAAAVNGVTRLILDFGFGLTHLVLLEGLRGCIVVGISFG